MNNNFMLHTSQPLIKPENTFVLDRKLISIHSVDRDHQKWPNSNQFGIDLGVAFSNVQSMRLVNFAVPTNNYTFSTAYQNTMMSFSYTHYYPLHLQNFDAAGLPLAANYPDSYEVLRNILQALFGTFASGDFLDRPSDVTIEFLGADSAGVSTGWIEIPVSQFSATGGSVPTIFGSGTSPNFNYNQGLYRIAWTNDFTLTIPEGSYSPTNLTETIQSLMNEVIYNASSQPGYAFLPGPAIANNISNPGNLILAPNDSNSVWNSSADIGIKPFIVHYNVVRNRILFGTKRGRFTLLFGKQEIYDPTCDVNKALFHQYTKWGLPSYLGFDKKSYTGTSVNINSDPYQQSIGGLYLPFESSSPWLTPDNRIIDVSGTHSGVTLVGADYDVLLADVSNNGSKENLVCWLSSEYNLDINGEDAIYMEIDRYNSIDEIYPYSERTGHLYNNDLGHRVNGSFAKIPLTHLPFGQEMGSRNNFVLNVFHSDPPIQRIDRLKFTFRFHDGRLVDFKNLPFSFTLEFNMLKDEQTRGRNVRVPPLYNL